MPKAKRRGKVFVDWSQNSVHKSTVAVYSLRAKGERPFVAMPLAWEELERALKRGEASGLFCDPEAALKRLEKSGDLFSPVLRLKQKLPKSFLDLQIGHRPNVPEQAKALEPYRQKRDFRKTAEPPPAIPPPSRQGGRRLFVIQKHAASHLHYDLRLQMDGVLKSWAIPKGPPYDVHERRLAMATEDHPMEYARFEGIIPAGEYGGGTVMVWDIGTYELIDGNYWKGKLHFALTGKKLKGDWVLVKAGDGDGKRNRWLWIKAGKAAPVLPPKQLDSSAVTGRSLEQIAKAGDAVWHSNRGTSRKTAPEPVNLQSLRDVQPSFIEPMLAGPVGSLPEDTGQWIYEIKLDGYRGLGLRDDKRVRLFSRNKHLLNGRFPKVAKALERLEPGTMTDGEIVALDESGRPSFNILQNHRSAAEQIHYYVFDLLTHRGKNLLGVPLEKRRGLLKTVVEPFLDTIRLSENFAGSATEIAAAAKELGVEGIIAKKSDSLYEPGERSGPWVKYRINQGQEFVVGGYLPGPQFFDSLLVGYYESDKLFFVAKIRNGFVPRVRREVFQRLKALTTNVCPFANLPETKSARRGKALTAEVMKECVWLKPKLVAEVEFTEWTEGDHLRHSKFVALRDDKNPREIRREIEWAPGDGKMKSPP